MGGRGYRKRVPRCPPSSRLSRQHVRLGPRRTMRQDPEFAIAQIVEIGLRAMSPAVNDPFTMLTCVDALAVCLRLFLVSPEHRPLHLDEQGTVRVREKPLTFERLAAAGFDPMRQVSRDSTAATIRIFQAIAALAPFTYRFRHNWTSWRPRSDLAREGFTLERRKPRPAAMLKGSLAWSRKPWAMPGAGSRR